MFESLKTILERSFKRLNLEPLMKEGRVMAELPELLEKDLAGEITFDRIEKGTLYLWAESPAGMSEVKLRQKSILKKVNDRLGDRTVSELKVSLARSPLNHK